MLTPGSVWRAGVGEKGTCGVLISEGCFVSCSCITVRLSAYAGARWLYDFIIGLLVCVAFSGSPFFFPFVCWSVTLLTVNKLVFCTVLTSVCICSLRSDWFRHSYRPFECLSELFDC